MEPNATSTKTPTLDMIRASAQDLQSPDPAKRARAEEIKRRYESGLFNDKLVSEGAKPVPMKNKPEEVSKLVTSAKQTAREDVLGKMKAEAEARPKSWVTRTIQDIPSDVVETLDRMVDAFTGRLDKATEIVKDDNLSLGQKFLGALVQPAVGVSDAFGEGVLGAAKLAFSPEAEEKIGQILVDTVTAGVESEPGRYLIPKVQRWYNSLDKDDKFLVDQIGGIGQVVTDVLLTKGALTVGKTAAKPTKSILKQGADVFATGAEKAQEALAQGARQVDSLFRETDEELARYVDEYFVESVKPSSAGMNTTGAVNRAKEQRQLAVQTIAENAENFRFVDDAGNEIVGQTPESLQQLGEAIEQTKAHLYKQYNALSKEAGEMGITVNTADFANELDILINDTVLIQNAPETVAYAKRMKEQLLGNLEEGVIYADEMPPSITPEQVEEAIKLYNQKLDTFYRNPTAQLGREVAVDALIVNNYRKALDKAIEGATGEKYQALKNQYGAVRSIEQDVMKAILRDQKRNTVGLVDFSDILSGGQLVSGIVSMNPSQIAQGATQAGIKQYFKFLNDPNQNIRRMFETQQELLNRKGNDMGPLESAFRNPSIGLSTKAVDDAGNPIRPDAEGNFRQNPEQSSVLPTPDEKNSFVKAGFAPDDNVFQVGITNVAGEGRFQSDEILKQANKAFDEGNLEEAERLYKEAIDFGIKTINERFQGTGIKVKTKAAYGVFEGRPEPSIEMSAVVPPKKVDEFHAILADLAGNNFNQDSVITYRNVANERPDFGVVDASNGIANEPAVRITLNRQLKLDEIKELSEMMQKNGVYAYSVLNDGKQIDILNLSYYNSDYGQFTENIASIIREMESRAIYEGVETATVETRHIGSSAGNGRTTYRQVRDNFQQANPERAILSDQRYRNSFLGSLPQKSFYSKNELTQALNRVQSPTDKEILESVIAGLPDKVSYKELDHEVKKFMLRTDPKYSNTYAQYGLDDAGIDYEGGTAAMVTFDIPVDTGVSGHLGNSNYLGWARIFGMHGDDTKYVSEMQSDPFQRGLQVRDKNWYENEIEIKKQAVTNRNNEIEELKNKIEYWKTQKGSDRLKKVDGGYQIYEDTNKEIVDSRRTFATRAEAVEYAQEWIDSRIRRAESDINTINDRILDYNKELERLSADLQEVGSPEYQAKIKQLQSLASGNKYRKRLLEETLFELAEKSPDRTVAIPTPSTVARIEWKMGSPDNPAPYRQVNGDPFRPGDADLEVGDSIEYLDEEYVVVATPAQGRGWGGPPPTAVVVAPADKVHTASYYDAIKGEIESRMQDVDYELRDLPEELTASQLLELANNADDWSLKQKASDAYANFIDEGGEIELSNPETGEIWGDIMKMTIVKGGDQPVIKKSELRERVEEVYEEDDWEQFWADIYGEDNVFIEYGGGGAGSSYGPTRVRFVEEGVLTETFDQPSGYDADIDMETLQEYDFSKEGASSVFSDHQLGVLDNYYDFQKYLKALEKEQDIMIDWNHTIESYNDYGSGDLTYIKVTVPKSFRISN